jgi:GT2 family glycosyltransferase
VQEQDHVAPTASIIVPTRGRPGYLDVTLASVSGQARELGAEVIVADDGPSNATAQAAARHGARYVAHEAGRGPNAARNTGIAAAGAGLLVILDDDIEAHPGWLAALLAADRELPAEYGVLAGRISARFEDHPLRSCGRHGPPITFLERGDTDTDVRYGWSANMAIRRAWFDRVGPFDEAQHQYGDETEWEDRLHAAGGKVRYVAAAHVDHRRAGDDARPASLMRAAYRIGRASRRFQANREPPPKLEREVWNFVLTALHALLRGCAAGAVLAAHNAGRIHETLTPTRPEPAEDFVSGQHGTVAGRRGHLRRYADRALDAAETLTGRRARLQAAAGRGPRRRVLVVGAHHRDRPTTTAETVAELHASHHEVTVDFRDVGAAGKFENLNAIVADHDLAEFDWLIAVDDDVELPRGFLDGFVHLAEAASFRLAQPAQTLASHAAWPIARRRAFVAHRRTTFVEIGPVTAFDRAAAEALVPFPPLRYGWGLELHWAAIARERGWPMGIVDALPVRHELRTVAAGYGAEPALAEARAFLAERPYLRRDEVRTLSVHRRL